MEITTVDDKTFKIKGRTGVAIAAAIGPTIESPNGEKMVFTGPGEYEVSGISVIGIPVNGEIVFIYEVDKLRICYMGNLSKKLLESKLSQIGNIDVLLVSVGNETIEIVQQIESYYVIPFGYKNDEELEKFLKASGLVVEKMTKFNIKKEELIEENPTQIIVLGK